MSFYEDWKKNHEETFKRELSELLPQLRELGVLSVSTTYYGGGDSGDFNDPTFNPQEPVITDQSLIDRASSALSNAVSLFFAGWENNEGGNGEVMIDVSSGRVQVNHKQYDTVTTSFNRVYAIDSGTAEIENVVSDMQTLITEMNTTRKEQESSLLRLLAQFLFKTGRRVYVRNYIPIFNDGDACLPSWSAIMLTPGYLADYNLWITNEGAELTVLSEEAAEEDDPSISVKEVKASPYNSHTYYDKTYKLTPEQEENRKLDALISGIVRANWEAIRGEWNVQGTIFSTDGKTLKSDLSEYSDGY